MKVCGVAIRDRSGVEQTDARPLQCMNSYSYAESNRQVSIAKQRALIDCAEDEKQRGVPWCARLRHAQMNGDFSTEPANRL
jgi:hypothetical protein